MLDPTFATIITQGALDWMKEGGTLFVYFLAWIGLASMTIGAIDKGGKYILRLTALIIAIPWIYFVDKRKK